MLKEPKEKQEQIDKEKKQDARNPNTQLHCPDCGSDMKGGGERREKTAHKPPRQRITKFFHCVKCGRTTKKLLKF